MSTLVFDIETVPDVDAGRLLFDLGGLDDADVSKAMFHLRRQATGSDFQPHHLQRVVAISCVLATRDSIKCWSLGEADADEAEIIRRFYDGLDRYSPDLVSWNGSGFDLPVLHYRALKHGITAARYWETGDSDQSFKWNNYLSRYHWRHLDLMDVMAGFSPRASAKLDQVAVLCGFPGKLGMDGSKVCDAWLNGEINVIRDYCETDVLNTYLVYLRFQLMRGVLGTTEYDAQLHRLEAWLRAEKKPHFDEFVAAWRGDAA